MRFKSLSSLASLAGVFPFSLNLYRAAAPAPAPAFPFYGVNGHPTWDITPTGLGYKKEHWPAIIQAMKDAGLGVMRCSLSTFIDWKGDYASDVDTILDFIDNYATPAGIRVTACATTDFAQDQANGTPATEASAYAWGVASGEQLALLSGKSPLVEIGNEDCAWVLNAGSGIVPTDYDNGRFQLARGFYRGVIDGFRAHDAKTRIAVGAITWLHTGFLDMLWNGTQPDGSSGHPQVRWDVTPLHWYTNDYPPIDDIENVTTDGGFNILAHVRDNFGTPIHINEFGANWNAYGSSETAVSAAIVGPYLMRRFVDVAKQYGIEHIAYYQAVDGSADPSLPATHDELNYGLYSLNMAGAKGRLADFVAFIAANPMP
jgi:hypothetical protein